MRTAILLTFMMLALPAVAQSTNRPTVPKDLYDTTNAIARAASELKALEKQWLESQRAISIAVNAKDAKAKNDFVKRSQKLRSTVDAKYGELSKLKVMEIKIRERIAKTGK